MGMKENHQLYNLLKGVSDLESALILKILCKGKRQGEERYFWTIDLSQREERSIK